MIIEAQYGKGRVESSELTFFTAKESRENRGVLFGVSREKFYILGVFADRNRADEVYDEMHAAYRAGKSEYKIPEA